MAISDRAILTVFFSLSILAQGKQSYTRMALCNTRSSPRNLLSLQQSLELANVSLENARKTKDLELSLELCGDAEATSILYGD